MVDKTPNTFLNVMLDKWLRYFGPMLTLVVDQEGAIVSDTVSKFCDRYGIRRIFAGTDDHTLTGLAERYIFIVRTASHKTWAESRKQGLPITQDQCVEEAAMCFRLQSHWHHRLYPPDEEARLLASMCEHRMRPRALAGRVHSKAWDQSALGAREHMHDEGKWRSVNSYNSCM